LLFSNLRPGRQLQQHRLGRERVGERRRQVRRGDARIDIALTNFAGPNGAFVSLAQDSGGAPGAVLGSGLIVDQPAYGSTFAYNRGSGRNFVHGAVGGFDVIGCSKLCKV
jgi:hypothetical protein